MNYVKNKEKDNVKTPRIFLSYCWANKSVADEIDKTFSSVGITLIRDNRDTTYKTNLKQFMRKVRDTDYVLTLISDEFLKSENCMYEIMELMTRDDYEKHTLQVVLDNARVFDSEYRRSILKYWKDKKSALKKDLIRLDPEHVGKENQTLKHYTDIVNNVGEFLGFINEENSPRHRDLIQTNYQAVFDFIGLGDETLLPELIQISNITDDEDREIAIDNFISVHSGFAAGYFLRAYNTKSPKLAVYFYTKAIELRPDIAKSYFYRGASKAELRDHPGAIADYDKAIELNPNDAEAYYNRGNSKLEMGNRPGAIDDYTLALEVAEKILGSDHLITKRIQVTLNSLNALIAWQKGEGV